MASILTTPRKCREQLLCLSTSSRAAFSYSPIILVDLGATKQNESMELIANRCAKSIGVSGENLTVFAHILGSLEYV